MWLLGVSLVLAALVAVLVGLRMWFNRMQDIRKPLEGETQPRDGETEQQDGEAEQRKRAVTASTIFISGSGRF